MRGDVEGIVKETVEASGGRLVNAPSISLPGTSHRNSGGSVRELPPLPTMVQYQPPNDIRPLTLTLPLHGQHQIDNLSTALGIIECLRQQPEYTHRIDNSSIVRGVRNTRWPGRMEFFQYSPSTERVVTILADGAHNKASATSLRRYIDEISPGRTSFVLSLSHSLSKDPSETLEPLLRPGDSAFMVPFSSVEDMPWVKPVNPTEMVTVAKRLIGESERIMTYDSYNNPIAPGDTSALSNALELVTKDSDLVVVAGSLYLIADLHRLKNSKPDVLFSL
ncbi:folylpolyglutamate synthase [Serendipita sp. 400]|nr:folylpolyglutamate synthase [Serendipita sp. 400]